MNRKINTENRAAQVLAVLYAPFLALTPEFGMFLLVTFITPSSLFEWNPWYYPFGFISALFILILSTLSYKYSILAAIYIWSVQAIYCFLWIVGKLLIYNQDLIFSLWFVVCGGISMYVTFSLYRFKQTSEKVQ